MIRLTLKHVRNTSPMGTDLHSIKYKRKDIGYINHAPGFPIYLTIEKDETHTDDNPDCPWMWILLKKKSYTIEEAAAFLLDNADKIFKKHKIWAIDYSPGRNR